MRFNEYLKDKFIIVLTYFFVLIIILVLLFTFNVNYFLIISIAFFYLLSIIISILYDYYRRKYFYNYIHKKLDELDKKYLIVELMNNPDFIDGKILKDYLYEIDKSYIEELNKYKYFNIEFREYIELWCHEIKTPISTSKMIIDNNKNKITNSILEEIDNIEYFIEQVLFYARSGSLEKDYLVNDLNLKNIVDNVIKNNKKNILSKKIKIQTLKESIYVKSDSKWLEYIINQIIINSIKYSKDKDSYINISYKINKNNIMLFIEDNGIGIKSEELNRVFDKGFTGSNGRGKYNSTGIGLYLCKKLCNKLGLSISINSKENIYTKVTIIFPLGSYTKEIE